MNPFENLESCGLFTEKWTDQLNICMSTCTIMHTETLLFFHAQTLFLKISGSSKPSHKSDTFLLGLWSRCGSSRPWVGGNGVQSEPKRKRGCSASSGHPHTKTQKWAARNIQSLPFVNAMNLFPLPLLPERTENQAYLDRKPTSPCGLMPQPSERHWMKSLPSPRPSFFLFPPFLPWQA